MRSRAHLDLRSDVVDCPRAVDVHVIDVEMPSGDGMARTGGCGSINLNRRTHRGTRPGRTDRHHRFSGNAGAEEISHIGSIRRSPGVGFRAQAVEDGAERILVLVKMRRGIVRLHFRPDERGVDRRTTACVGSASAFVERHQHKPRAARFEIRQVENG